MMLRRGSLVLATLLALSGVALADHFTYRLSVSASPAPTVGQSSQVWLRVFRSDGVQVRHFDDLHTKPMHFIAVSQDLEDFAHLHPRLSPWGYLSTRLSFSRPTPYVLFAEFDPAGSAGEQTTRRVISPVGSQPTPAALDGTTAFNGSVSRQVTRSGTRVELVGVANQRVRSGIATSLHVRVEDPSGAPVGLTDYMGMPAHAIVISEDLRDFLHLHGMVMSGGSAGVVSVVHDVGGHGGHGGTTPPSTSTDSVTHLMVEATFPRPGLYKVWIQVQRGTTVVTAPFVVRAS